MTKNTTDNLIQPAVWHRSIDGTQLTRAREKAGLSQAQFATEAGWSQQYQARLEAPSVHEIRTEHAEKITAVLDNYRYRG